MDPQLFQISAGQLLFNAGDSPKRAFLIKKGKVRVTRLMGELELPISLLGEHDIVAAELLADPDQAVSYTVSAVEDTEGYVLAKEDFAGAFKEVSPWAQPLLLNYFYHQRSAERPERSNVSTLYGILNSFYAFLRLVDPSGSTTTLRGPLNSVTEEVQKSRSVSRYLVGPVFEALSQVALIDIRRSDPIRPLIIIPDLQLFMGFLVVLQNAADLKDGLHDNLFMLNPLNLSREAERVINNLMVDEQLADRMFEPERSMVHLPFEQLADIYKSGNNDVETLDPYHPSIKELEQHAAFTRVVDNERVSVFLNLRNLMRLTIRREPMINFIDVIDYLLDTMHETRYEHNTPKIFNMND
ncbi:cyclic nucleotide-binding domain-containing protein [bacterium]|nr:cyclic nucleotide-binding domain-containing protein [bacterium]